MKINIKKIALETLVIILVLIVAGAIVLFLFSENVGQTTYDTYTGNVNKQPLIITSPVYGQVLTVPLMQGQSIKKGQVLVTIKIINRDTLPKADAMYGINGDTLTIHSPTDGIVAVIVYAPDSTVGAANTLVQLYTPKSMDIQLLVPQGSSLNTYTAFYAVNLANNHRYKLTITGQEATSVLANINPTTTVYGAQCSKCQELLKDQSIPIYAQRKQIQSPFYNALNNFVNAVKKHL